MIKNIGKFKQWTGEKIGKSPKTRMDEDFNSLTDETEAKRVALEKLSESSQAYLKAISKRVEGEDKFKGLAIEAFGMSMSAQSYTLRDGSTYRQALMRMGDAHQNMGIAQTELITRFSNSYIECLAKAQAQMKEYQAMQKKLQSRRLDYDAKLAKVQKAKKEKPEWEEEMQAAKSKYEDTRECVLGIMTAISDSQDDDVNSLKLYYDAQLAYARKMVEVLESIPESTFVCSPNGSQSSLHTKPLHRQYSRDTDDSQSVHSDDPSSYPNRCSPLDRTPSTADLRRQSSVQHGNPDMSKSMSHLNPRSHLRRNGSIVALPPPPPTLPVRSTRKQVRALYNYDATAEGELSIQKGDIIGIVEEIDEGWWVGELVDANGERQEGMFPSNYCEEVITNSQRQHSVSSNTSDPGRYVDEDQAAYYERESEPTIQYSEPEPIPEEPEYDVPARRAPPPPTPARQVHAPVASLPSNGQSHHMSGSGIMGPGALARATPPPRPMSAACPLQRAPTIGSRAPPPPPSRRTAVTTENASSPAPGTPSGHMGGYIPRDYFSAPQETQVGPCRECQCDDFAPNVFKRGSCNNCFHAH
ncbi:hypothetical protein CPB97_006538 [Podila verticillata]|nr:hypothetical protein CPB97_006538 [Podila verticillata]